MERTSSIRFSGAVTLKSSGSLTTRPRSFTRGNRDGNGPIKGKGQGFYLHLAVAVGGDDDRRALGVLGATTYAHPKDSARKKMTLAQRQKLLKELPREQKISSRWEQLARSVQDALPAEVEAIHVMDQEADDFLLMSELTEAGLRFVVRGSGSRATAAVQKTVAATMRGARGVLFRTVAVNARRLSSRKSRPTRSERIAEFSVRWAHIDIRKPSSLREEGVVRDLPVTVVHVYEAKPPKGEAPIEWFLFTNEDVQTLADVERVVDHYRARWVVEEFFKALKTGCAVERRQLTTFDALNRILGVLLPIAWRLLLLRHLGSKTESGPSSEVMTESQIELLRVLLKARRPKDVLPDKPSVRDVMLGIAALGGHIPNNGEPGWIVLGRGFQIHADAEILWDAMRCDQS